MTVDSIIAQIDAALARSDMHRLTQAGRLAHIDKKVTEDVEALITWEKLNEADAKRVREHLLERRTNLSNDMEKARIDREVKARNGRWGRY